MRAKLLLVGGLALLFGCSGPVSHAPPPLNKELLAGKWKNASEAQFVAGYEFAGDGTLKMTILGREQPIQGRYTWSGERTLDLEYSEAPDVRQAYRAAAKAFKDQLTERIKTGKLPDRAGPSMLGAVPDELPAKATVRVAISDQPRQDQPRLLILSEQSGASQTFEKAD
jgi:hypothetical protein